jgi:hypothetical protein
MRKDSVVGWGDVIVPIGGKPSEAFRCLMVHRYITTVDSILLDGKPAPAALLQAFGLVQAKQSLATRKLFWRTKELYPEALFSFGGANFNTFNFFSANQHSGIVGTNDFVFNNMTSVAPNPTTNHRFHFMPSRAEPMTLTVTDISGRIILTTALEASTGEVQIELPYATKLGLCVVRIDYQTSKTSEHCKLMVQ